MNTLSSLGAESDGNAPSPCGAYKRLAQSSLGPKHGRQSNPLQAQSDRLLNRELSWLAFNTRVLEEAQNLHHPILERVRFCSISANNHDEFLMVRVASLRQKITQGFHICTPDGLSPRQQHDAIMSALSVYITQLNRTWRSLKRTLSRQGISFIRPKQTTHSERRALAKIFIRDIAPSLDVLPLDPARAFPCLPTQTTALLFSEGSNQQFRAKSIIALPLHLPRFIRLPGTQQRYVLLEDLIVMHVRKLIKAPGQPVRHTLFRVLRSMVAEPMDEYAPHVKTANSHACPPLQQLGNVVNLAVRPTVRAHALEFLQRQLHVETQNVARYDFIGMQDLRQIIPLNPAALVFQPYQPRYPQVIKKFNGDCFAAIRHEDILLYHPYESFDAVVHFIQQAARAPDVIAIHHTIYRTSANSPIIRALITAAKNQKQVTVVIELKARFDEAANLLWAQKMQAAGIRVVFSPDDQKAHAKVALVTCQNGTKITRYAHFGTGNYHPETARIYADLSLFTCNRTLCNGAAQVFDHLTKAAPVKETPHLSVAPFHMRQTLAHLIATETKNAVLGLPAAIWLKCNALGDPAIIALLYQASQAGVAITLMVRGICMLRPGFPGLSENIQVFSMVGRFLEHARVYCFGNGRLLPSRQAHVYIASGDLMPHNLDSRIETLVRITNPRAHHRILHDIMLPLCMDREQTWLMHADGTYTRRRAEAAAFSAQAFFMQGSSDKQRTRIPG